MRFSVVIYCFSFIGFFALTRDQRFFFVEYLKDILRFFEPYIRVDGVRVGSVEVLSKHLLQLSSILPAESRSEVLLVESLLCMLTQTPAHYPTLLHRVIYELCRLSPSNIPVALATGLSLLYGLIPAMDVCSWRQLSEWLSFHLTNTKLAWPYWVHWAAEMDGEAASVEDNSKLFLAHVIDKCTRNMFPEKMKAVLPIQLHTLIPMTDCKFNCPAFGECNTPLVAEAGATYSSACTLVGQGRSLRSIFTPTGDSLTCSEAVQTSITALATELLEMVKTRDDVSEIEEWMEVIRDVDDHAEAEGWRAGLFMQAIVIIGGKIPFGGTLTLLDKQSYRVLLRDLAGSPEDQKVLLSALVEAVGADQGMFSILFDALLRRGVIGCDVAALWLFSPQTLGQIHRDCWVVSHAETIIDRALDSVMAAFLQRRKLQIESSMDVESDAVTRPADMSGAAATVFGGGKSESTDAEPEADADSAQKEKQEAAAAAAIAIAANLEAVEAALTAAVEACCGTYKNAVGALIAACSAQYNAVVVESSADDSPPHLDPEFLCLFSLLKRTLRVCHGTESELHKHCGNEERAGLVLTALREVRANVSSGSVAGFTAAGVESLPSIVRSHLEFF